MIAVPIIIIIDVGYRSNREYSHIKEESPATVSTSLMFKGGEKMTSLSIGWWVLFLVLAMIGDAIKAYWEYKRR